MICDSKDNRKQTDGMLIGSVVFNPRHSVIESILPVLNKSFLNPTLQSIQVVINQNDVISENTAMALKCLQPLVMIIHKTYDNKVH